MCFGTRSLEAGGESRKRPEAGYEDIYVWAIKQLADLENMTGGNKRAESCISLLRLDSKYCISCWESVRLLSLRARSIFKHVYPFSGRAETKWPNPAEDGSHSLAETNTKGVGHSLGADLGGSRKTVEYLLCRAYIRLFQLESLEDMDACDRDGAYFLSNPKGMAAATPSVVFTDILDIKGIDKEGKKFDRVSRLYARSQNFEMDVTLDYNIELFSVKEGDHCTLTLASSLSRSGPSTTDADEEDKDRPVWRPDGKGRRGLEEDFDYVMYGKVYKFDGGNEDVVTAYASFGGLLLSLTGFYRHLSNVVLGDPVYLLLRK